MTRDQVEAFLTDAGVVFSSSHDRSSNVIEFKNRGTSLKAIAYDDGDLLHLTCCYRFPPGQASSKNIREAFQGVEDAFPIVKVRAIGSKEDVQFEISAEQFEPDVDNIARVFWRTADLVVAAADECYRRLGPQASVKAPEPDMASQWVVALEQKLLQGSLRPSSKGVGGDATIYDRVKSALALVVTKDERTGSAFCVASGPNGSYYVTNAHVTKASPTVTLYRQRPHYEKMEATVVAEDDGDEVDLALLHVEVTAVAPLKLKKLPPSDESAVALAGYARVQLWAAERFGELIPSVHLGTVTGVVKNGACVLHDVVCRPGNSGGPLFEPTTGEVVGVEQAGWQDEEEGYGIGVPVLAAFLETHEVQL